MEVIEETFFDCDDSEKDDVWNDLRVMRAELNKCGDISNVKAYIHSEMKDDVLKLQKLFKKEFKDVENDDPLRMEILQTMGELGIIIY